MGRTRLAVLVACLIGIPAGIGAFTFVYAKGFSYLSTDPRACANCHIMTEQFDGWLKSSHYAVAVCNDCHTPPGLVGKYTTKARNGFWHSYYFTTGWFEDNIHITPRGREVTEKACRDCHQEIVDAIEGARSGAAESQTSCLRCHDSVGHMH